jgi:hypothetical protein
VSRSDEPAADDHAATCVAHGLEAGGEEHRQVAGERVDDVVALAHRVCLEDVHTPGACVVQRAFEERRRDTLAARGDVDGEADERPDVLVVHAREPRGALEPLEALARAEPAPADGVSVGVRDERRCRAFSNLRLEPCPVGRAPALVVRLAADVPVLAPAAGGERNAAPRTGALEEVDDVRPAGG